MIDALFAVIARLRTSQKGDLFGLLGNGLADSELEEMVRTEWAARWQNTDNEASGIHLPRAD